MNPLSEKYDKEESLEQDEEWTFSLNIDMKQQNRFDMHKLFQEVGEEAEEEDEEDENEEEESEFEDSSSEAPQAEAEVEEQIKQTPKQKKRGNNTSSSGRMVTSVFERIQRNASFEAEGYDREDSFIDDSSIPMHSKKEASGEREFEIDEVVETSNSKKGKGKKSPVTKKFKSEAPSSDPKVRLEQSLIKEWQEIFDKIDAPIPRSKNFVYQIEPFIFPILEKYDKEFSQIDKGFVDRLIKSVEINDITSADAMKKRYRNYGTLPDEIKKHKENIQKGLEQVSDFATKFQSGKALLEDPDFRALVFELQDEYRSLCRAEKKKNHAQPPSAKEYSNVIAKKFNDEIIPLLAEMKDPVQVDDLKRVIEEQRQMVAEQKKQKDDQKNDLNKNKEDE